MSMDESESENSSINFGDYALLIDTDSCSIEIGPAVKRILGEIPNGEWTDDQVTKVCDYLDNDLSVKLNNNCKKICHDIFLSDQCSIEFKREKCASTGLFLQKKNYSVLVYDSEGVRHTHWVHTGNVLKKSSTPKRLKEKMKHIVEYASIHNWKQREFEKYCRDLYEEIKTWDPSDFCKACGYSTEKKFAEPFMFKGVTSSTAIAANLYNDMIDFCHLQDKEAKIKVGDKFRMIYVKPDNRWKIEYIGFIDKFPKPFFKYLEIDYKTNFEKYFIKPLERYLRICKWRAPELNQETLFDIDDL